MMNDIPIERIKRIKSFPSLVKFLREELEWPLDGEDIEDLFFDYEPDELGINPEMAVKIKEIKLLRPFVTDQPWGIFYLSFEPKRLPVVVMRRVLQALVIKKRQSANPSNIPTWERHDLLFISSYGEEDQRGITFAHFREDAFGDLPALRVIGWDAQDTPLHIDQCVQELDNLRFDVMLSPDEWREQWSSAFTLKHREAISNSKALAAELALLAGQIRRRVNAVLRVESKQGPMQKLYKAIQETLLHDTGEDQFADMFAQTIAYGLFSARCSRNSGCLVADNLTDMIPETNLFLRELLSTFFSIGGRKGRIDFDELGINDVVDMLREANMEAVLRDFGDRNPSEDPVIHFYEGFLKQYDANQKIKRGAFYTPRPVVSFIVRSVHEILREDFGLEDGLADTTTWGEFVRRNREAGIPEGVSEDAPFVQILDPATGTGTFLVEVIDLIHKTMAEKWEDEGEEDVRKLWNEYVPGHLLPRVYGFELMMAPYTIAHMKVALKLIETGYVFKFDETIRIHLTNSLEEDKDTLPDYLEGFSPALAHEAKAANSVKKDAPITVVIGNPPYSYKSANTGDWISKLVKDYYEVDGKPLGERNPKGLQDDYVKFIRFGQNRIDNAYKGILAFITNHSFLDNPTFRGMRQSLMNTFDQMYFIDLHGNAKKKEKTPEGGKDENIFDIEQGVAISLMLQKENLKKKIYHADFWGERDEKYNLRLKNSLGAIDKAEIGPSSPFYLFRYWNEKLRDEYEIGYKIKEIFKIDSMGITTGKDKKFVSFSKHDLKEQFPKSDKITDVAYRVFDKRKLLYDEKLLERPRTNFMRHLTKPNYAFVTLRRPRNQMVGNFFITDCLTDKCIISSLDNAQIFLLYRYEQIESVFDFYDKESDKNLKLVKKENFTKIFRTFINNCYNQNYTPEQILRYIYSILYSLNYRERYVEFLKIDFPRIPFTSNQDLFLKLSVLGSELISLHLMESDKLGNAITTFPVPGDNSVTKVGEAKKQLKSVKNGKDRLYINKTQYFDGLPEDVWNFHIGGYQVCHKWLYDRKKAKRRLSQDDIAHYHKIVTALNETIRVMKEIDETIDAHGGWPIQ